MGLMHASLLLLAGYAMVVVAVVFLGMSSGLWLVYVKDGVTVDAVAETAVLCVGFMILILPFAMFWLGEVEKAYRS